MQTTLDEEIPPAVTEPSGGDGRSSARLNVARVLGRVGRVLITVGVLVLAFVAYQLWGTGLHTADAQRRADQEFAREAAAYETAHPDTPPTSADPPSTPADQPEIPAAPGEGGLVGQIDIPAIDLHWSFFEGVDESVLKNGPGHYMGTPLPGQPGNAGIAGHRTTYGAPFNRLDEIGPGDEITVTYTTGATYTYEYRSTEIVSPDQTEILHDAGDNRLTLTACHPKYSARQRIAVIARLEDEPASPASTAGDVTPPPPVFGFDGPTPSKVPAILWGVAAAMIWLAAYFVGRAWRKWPSYVLAFPFFAVATFLFFDHFYVLLPAGF